MRIISILGATLLLLVCSFYIFIQTLPKQQIAEHEEFVYSSPALIYNLLSNPDTWEYWMEWGDSLANYEQYRLLLNSLDNRSQKIEEIEILKTIPNESIRLGIHTSSKEVIEAQINLQESNHGTLVRWTSYIDLPTSSLRLFGFFIKRWLIRDMKLSSRKMNKYLLFVGEHTGWSSDEYTIIADAKSIIYYQKDTLKYSEVDSVMRKHCQSTLSFLKKEYDYIPRTFFYREIAQLEEDRAVFLYGSDFLDESDGSSYFKSIHFGYLTISYYGSFIGVKKVEPKAQKVAELENIEIESNPFVVRFNPCEMVYEDTSSMNLSYPLSSPSR